MKCPNCGRKIPDGSQVCPGCKKQLRIKTVGTLSGAKLGRLLYAALFVCAILVLVLVFSKWHVTSIGQSYSLAEMTEMYSAESASAGWFVNATYAVLSVQLLAIIMWIVTFSKPSPVIPLLAGGVTFIGALVFLIMAIFGLGAAFAPIPNFTRTATVMPYLTLLLSAGELACAWYAPKLLAPAFAESGSQKGGSASARPGGTDSVKKLIDELDGMKHDSGSKRGGK